jgi:hypothetical protein
LKGAKRISVPSTPKNALSSGNPTRFIPSLAKKETGAPSLAPVLPETQKQKERGLVE